MAGPAYLLDLESDSCRYFFDRGTQRTASPIDLYWTQYKRQAHMMANGTTGVYQCRLHSGLRTFTTIISSGSVLQVKNSNTNNIKSPPVLALDAKF